MNPVTIEEVTSPGCKNCQAFENFWHSIEKDYPNVAFKKYEITTPEGGELAQKHMILASPGIIVNGELFAVGGFDQNAFLTKLKSVSGQPS